MTPSKILWLSNAPSFRQSVEEGWLCGRVTGGVAYNFDAYQALSKEFNMGVDPAFTRGEAESMLSYGRRIAKLRTDADLLIKDPMVFTFHHEKSKAKTIGMVHHIDYLRKRSSIRHWAYLRRLERMLTKLDRVVVVSEFWKDYVTRLGVNDAMVIYNSFDVKEFEVTAAPIEDFSNRYDIPNDRPVVYIGMASSIKGFERAYDILKDEHMTLIATGEWKGPAKPGFKVLQLDRPEFLAMLHRADVTVSLPSIPEGWSRVAHESLLCGTPVIGLRSGGMTELLTKSGQTIISSDRELMPAVQKVLSNQAELSKSGLDFVRQFDMEYFKKAWVETCESLV